MPLRSPRRWPVRARLVAAFIAVMLAVLTAAGAFVFWRVEVALDRTLNQQLHSQASTMQVSWRSHVNDARSVVAALPAETLAQVVDGAGARLASTPAAASLTLLPHRAVADAAVGLIALDPGNVLTGGSRRLRIVAFNLPTKGSPVIAVTAVRLGQRDEALRELLAQLAIANLVALAAASTVGYRLARASLVPVERYRKQAEQITRGATGVRLDVSADVDDEISRLGHTLNQMLAVQEQSAERQRQFIADASHELRTPLTVLTSEVELALRRPRTIEDYQHTLQQIALDTARLVALAEQLLDLEQSSTRSAVNATGMPLADLSPALLRVAARGRSRLADSGRAIEVEQVREPVLRSSADEHRTLRVDGVDLDQILGNLVDNAALHGQGTLTVTAALINDHKHGWLVLDVHDEGEGPPADFVPHAVERFRRADGARSTPGNGLGLALVHSLVTSAGGELRICTAVTRHAYQPEVLGAPPCTHERSGTTVTALLPLRA